MDYDVIVVGARVAGATTAMLLARRGLRVLVVDRVAFPSDTISSHQIQVPGVARLRRWGLLEAVRAAGTPPTRRLRFDAGEVVLDGSFPPFEGADALYSPRRTLLDAALVDAARSAGADVRENFRVEELVWSEGRVVGVRGRERLGSSVALRARIVVGADGKNSFVASAVGARTYRQRPVRAFACYTYFSGLPVTAGEVYRRRGRLVAVFPTNDDLTMVYLSEPLSGFEVFRRDIEKHYLAALDGCGDLGGRAREARREERLRTTPDQPNRFRLPHGPGWALVGDAGVVMDSVSAQGITNALRDADLLAEALSAELDGVPSLAAYHRRRDRAVRPMYDHTVGLAGHSPGITERLLYTAVADRPAEVTRFLGVFSGALPPDSYLNPAAMLRVFGAAGRTRGARRRRARAA
ncbi:2-polyprenyl-6-methoxyphenol hydroxylase-like FAD-dependent oxidoreductase [Actinomadura luteofluorescens]|uniref:2-polyprenyl-6-methoxyphenol hydroxylase-like FAD-dependent oxidoreductase n=1 Tax=Actinomadura luteofluorescens TaxID=46163 RepID=A0A7Y9JEG7_9ACTN|nr:NAD(P)/FAD-dependent oxidoreductase [Actinomadura luteofluorescens]NYD45925.1 2-polyprenyl-6-methoxyphenol hydroxylase-like FAD-dependent oxidoreductase [Actinomadura luteofluorescens]